MTPDEHATLMSAYLLIGLLVVSLLAAVARWWIHNRARAGATFDHFVEDVRRGEGFTFHRDIMSSPTPATENKPLAGPLAATAPAARQGIATPGNAVNAILPGNDLAAAVVPAAARDIIRFETKVEDAVAIIASGKVGQVEAIELIFGCKRSGRPDSPYARARAAVAARLGNAPKFRADDGTLENASYPVSSGAALAEAE